MPNAVIIFKVMLERMQDLTFARITALADRVEALGKRRHSQSEFVRLG